MLPSFLVDIERGTSRKHAPMRSAKPRPAAADDPRRDARPRIWSRQQPISRDEGSATAPLEELATHLNLGVGEWYCEIVHGKKKAGEKVRTESYEPIPVPGAGKSRKRVIGEAFVEYLHLDTEGDLSKSAEDDTDVEYGANIVRGVLVPVGMKVGDTVSIDSKLEAFKAEERSRPT